MSEPVGQNLTYSQGSLLFAGQSDEQNLLDLGFVFDPRTLEWRAPAISYAKAALHFHEKIADFRDGARAYEKLNLTLKVPIVPREHQAKALTAWVEKGCRGVVSLPTGAGKTILAVLAMVKLGRPTLILVPTIDLLLQWQRILEGYFSVPIGALGGGSKDLQNITISTYDSALIFVESIGNRFGFLVVDECHHLPAIQYQKIALATIAPFRLGLSATPERADGKDSELDFLLGETVYKGHIHEMTDTILSPYEVVSLRVSLTDDEKERYQTARKTYLGFAKHHQINFGSPYAWGEFLAKASRFPGGKAAMRAYREQKRIAQAASAKIHEVWRLLNLHKDEQVIIFTDDNALAYHIGQQFVLAVLTHQTKLVERKKFLDAFRSGELKVLVASKVLNEGVDVPEASVAIVVSGSAGVREHVQRLGRILRRKPGKKAVLYELIASGTSEVNVNQRRRKHDAYQGSAEV